MVETSRSTGTWWSVERPETRIVAAIIGKTAFFAPDTCRVPDSFRPPSITNLSITTSSRGTLKTVVAVLNAVSPIRSLSRCGRPKIAHSAAVGHEDPRPAGEVGVPGERRERLALGHLMYQIGLSVPELDCELS